MTSMDPELFRRMQLCKDSGCEAVWPEDCDPAAAVRSGSITMEDLPREDQWPVWVHKGACEEERGRRQIKLVKQ